MEKDESEIINFKVNYYKVLHFDVKKIKVLLVNP